MPKRNTSKTRRDYLKGLATTITAGLATTTTTASAADASRFTSDLGEIRDATLAASSDDAIIVQKRSTRVAPGITLDASVRLTERGWLDCDVLTVTMDGETGVTLLSSGVTERDTVPNLAEESNAVAGVNGDFFYIGESDAPVGAEIGDGNLRSGPATGREHTVAVGDDGLARLARVILDGAVRFHGTSYSLNSLNQPDIPADGLGLYTSLWGDAERTGEAEVVVRNGVVTSTSTSPGSATIPNDGSVLVGRGTSADALSTLSTGDAVSVSYGPQTDADASLQAAVGGSTVLLRDGEIPSGLDDGRLEPRTAVGVSEDGLTLYLLVVDGRQRDSRGASLKELAEAMRDLGATDALNFDGGGSSTLVARNSGEESVSVRNDPSDGAPRPVSNGLGLTTAEGSGRLDGFDVTPMLDGENTHRVFPELSRQFVANAHDETYAPVEAMPRHWRTIPRYFGRFDADGLFTGRRRGSGKAIARKRGNSGTTEVRVLDDLDRIEPDQTRIGLAAGDTRSFAVLGFDARGYTAPIAPRDVTLDYDDSLVSIEATDEGTFTVTPTGGNGSTLITVSVLDEETYLPVSVGLTTKTISKFEDPTKWYFARYPSAVEGSMSFVKGRSGTGLRLDYDFTTTTATRAAYARTESPIDLPGEPQRVGVWIDGDGKGAWIRGVLTDAAGVTHKIDFTYSLDWTGWQYIEGTVPAGVEYPLQFSYFYAVEASEAQQYEGSLVFDDLTVKVTPPVSRPEKAVTPDPLVVEDDELSEDRWTFAVMADSQFVADDPDSLAVNLARRTLREIVAADPDFLVIAGDFVDTGYREDYALANRILREEVGDALPVYYLPGNHERTGPGDLSNFKAAFGDTRYTFDHEGTRFFLLDSSTGSFRTSDFQQLSDLQRGLNDAADADAIENVVVVAHHPPRDPLVGDNSQLGDRMEAELIEEWLTAFREQSDGKGAVYVAGHAGTVEFSRVEGVPYVVLGTTGKYPYGSPDDGGFREWTLFGVDPTPNRSRSPAERTDWLRAEVRPLLTDVTFDTPQSLRVGESLTVSPTGVQDAGLTFPLRYPATVRWSGSQNLHIADNEWYHRFAREDDNDEQEANRSRWHGRDYAAAFDPETRQLIALDTGTVTLRASSNGVSGETTITITDGN
ncbi:phosphodiester glycosidase family protein [Haladaptatus cibarius]|uniref:phosphodiester glycosidase family protein n=1 Tax=Haladaptatus cibarius TaxID=453847 RepID=UPI0011848389|nr:phosphodiester glycosidase family protein [Haladaptatus cibarius]